MPPKKISILGAGSFGSAMAHVLSHKSHEILLWSRDQNQVLEINNFKTNSRANSFGFASNVRATTDIHEAKNFADYVIFALPCQALSEFISQNFTDKKFSKPFINLAKGIDIATGRRPSQIFANHFGDNTSYVQLSGPTFAHELCLGMPTAAVLAGYDFQLVKNLQTDLSTKFFRLYTSGDVIGVELGGALKNIMAIEVGMAEGLGFAANTRAGLITRCLHEMTELGLKLGANPRTFAGLSGVGDLILTCTGDLSRNRQIGLGLGSGESLSSLVQKLGHVAEGIPTAKAAFQLSQNLDLDLPNIRQVYRILHEQLSPKQALDELLSRELKSEF